MTNNNLAIKYRPNCFDDVVGNELVTMSLSASRIMNNIPNAILLSGPSGVGKTTIARIYAKYINCENPVKSENSKHAYYDVCNQCDSCKYFNHGNPIDFREMNAANQRGIDDMRNLIESTYVSNFDLNYKIILIDECQQLTKEAQNLMLKPLEEPNTKNIFIFCTTNPEKVLNTVINRCRRFDLRKIQNNLCFNRLKEIINIEKIECQDSVLEEIIYNSDGSLRKALNILDQANCAGNGKILIENISSLTNTITLNVVYYLIDNILLNNPYNISKLVLAIDEKSIPTNNVLDRIISYLNDILLFVQTNSENILQYQEKEYIGKVKEHAKILNNKETVRDLIKCLLEKYKYIDFYPRQNHLLNLGFSECVDIVYNSKINSLGV